MTTQHKAQLTRAIKKQERELAFIREQVANGSWQGIHIARCYLTLRWLREVRRRINSMPVGDAYNVMSPTL